MKRLLVLLIPCLLSHFAYSQFGSLINKVKNKVASKLGQNSAKDSTSHLSPDTTSVSPHSTATTGQGTSPQSNNIQPAGDKTPQPPQFPKTGILVKATTVIFGIDSDEDWANLLKNPMVQDFISQLRQKGVTGTDKEVLTIAMQHSDAYSDIISNMRAKYGNTATFIKPFPSLVFSVFFSEYDYIISKDFIRAELGKGDTSNRQPGIAATLINGLAPGATTIIDVKARKSYTVANYLGILPAAIEEDISSFQDAFGLATYFKKYMHQPGLKLQPLGHKTFHGYNTSVVTMEIPVTPTTDDNGKPSDGLLYLHSLLSSHMEDISAKHYDPSYKLYLETYYSHDLDASIPAPVISDKNILHVDGFYVGTILKDENGNQVIYDIKKVDTNSRTDEGQFQIPDGYEKMTHAQFREKLKEKLHAH
jgi:hypothetical protein